jgi:hypothetical protein
MVIFSQSEDTSCNINNKITTNVKISDLQYNQAQDKQITEGYYKNQNLSTLIYNYSIRIESIESPNSSVLQEAENIIQNSVFK